MALLMSRRLERNSAFGDLVGHYANRHHLHQKTIATELRVSSRTLRRIKKGMVPASAEIIERLKTVLGIPSEEMDNVLWTSRKTFPSYLTSEAAPARAAGRLGQHGINRPGVDPLVARALFLDPDAMAFRKLKDEECASFGKNFEVRNWVLPFRGRIENGLAAASVTIRPEPLEFTNFAKSLIDTATVGRVKSENRKNGRKLSLISIEPQNVSDEDLSNVRLETFYTDYFTVRGCLATLTRDRDLRHKQMALDPRNNKVPGYLCLHYVLRFTDKTFLTIHRSNDVSYEQGRISFSGEEQLTPEDTYRDNSPNDWTIRTLMQEAFHYRNYRIDSPESDEVRSMNRSMNSSR